MQICLQIWYSLVIHSHFFHSPVSSKVLAPASEIEVACVIHDIPVKKSDGINVKVDVDI